MAFTGPAEDRMAIRELYASYGDGSSRGNREDWLACWADDGKWSSHLFNLSGKDEIRGQWDAIWVNFDKVGFLGEVGSIEVDGDTAKCRSIAREIIGLKGGGVYKLVGTYDDTLVRRNGQWLFLERHYTPLVEELPA